MAADQPNILLITSDQQRYDTTGPQAPPWMRTPHFNHLAAEGITFSRAYADCPLCVPARVSIMTGQTILRHGCNGNRPTSGVMGRESTLPARMRRLGYQTAAIGKMHFGPERARHGFDEMILPADYYRHMERLGLDVPQPMRHGMGQNELYPAMATVPESLTLTNWIAQQCVEYVRERRDPTAPFFLWCSFSKPHPPLDPPEPYYSMYRNCNIPAPIDSEWSKGEQCPETFRRRTQSWNLDRVSPEILREARAAYYGLVTQNDYNMGRVFAALQDMDLFNDTLIIYTSDHGEYLGDHGSQAKSFFHEPSAHVPFALRLPKNWPDRLNDVVLPALVTHADILPTCVAAAGGQCGDDVDGVDLISLVRGEAEPRPYLDATSEPSNQQIAITDGRWKYLWFPQGGEEQLFDIESDPQERHDLADSAEVAGERDRLRKELIRRHAEAGTPYVANGDLAVFDLPDETEASRRNRSWPGYHTEHFEKDVRH